MGVLIRRLEAAMEGSRELDVYIFAQLHPRTKGFDSGAENITITRAVKVYAEEDPEWFFGWASSCWGMPHYTTSLDAALTLVPEGWNRRLSEDDGGKWWAELRHSHETAFSKIALASKIATPALALCISAMKARE